MDIVITDKAKKDHKANSSHSFQRADQPRSKCLLGLATTVAPQSGSSSVLDIASKWNIEIIKYQDIISTMKNTCLVRGERKSLERPQAQRWVRALKGPFIKVEDQSRKYGPEFLEMKTFPYIDFSSSTGSPFDKWFKENSKP